MVGMKTGSAAVMARRCQSTAPRDELDLGRANGGRVAHTTSQSQPQKTLPAQDPGSNRRKRRMRARTSV
jgi:hypothetical protein